MYPARAAHYSPSATGNANASSSGNQTSSRYDAANHKISEGGLFSTDKNGDINWQKSWQYDIATGRLISKTDLGKHVTLYAYNYNSQVTEEHGAGDYNKDILTSYNQLGQAVFIDDKGTQTYTRYQYDVAGRRLTESVTQTINGVASILQDNHLGYDKLGRLAVVQNGRYALTYGYDANGNRTMMDSFYVTDNTVRSNNTTGGTQVNSVIEHKTTWSTYDAMNRQVIADGSKDDKGSIVIGTTGHTH